MKKALFVCLALCVSISLFAGGGRDSGRGTKTPLTFWTYVEQHTEFFYDAVESWNAENPNEQIELSCETYPVPEMHSKLMITLQSGSGAPDIVDVNVAMFSDFIFGDRPAFVDLSSVINPEKSSFLESVLDIYARDGKYYGIEYHVGAPMMYYNVEILGRAGIKPEDIVTWDDLHEAGKKLLAATGIPIITFETRDSWSFFNMIGSKGGDYFDANGNCIINSKGNADVLQFMLDMLADGTAILTPGGWVHDEQFYGFMENGGAASVQLCAWYLGRFTDFMPGLAHKIQVAPIPVWDVATGVFPVYGGTGTCVTTQSKNQDLATRFLAHAKTSKEGATKIWTVLGFDPLRWDIWQSPEVNQPNKYSEYITNNFFDVLMTMRPKFHTMNITASPKFSLANSLAGSDILFRALDEKSQTPQQALDAAAREIAISR